MKATLLRRLGFAVLGLVVLLALVAFLPLALTPRHQWRTPAPFAGPALCNPYAAITGQWKKTNFHAHSNVHEGNRPPCYVIAKYRSLGYDIAQVADHNVITDTSSCNDAFIPAYEHGANMQEVHFTSVGAHDTKLEEYPLLQFTAQKQHTIDRLRTVSDYVVINHPWKPIGFAPEEFAKLDGYDAVEIQGRGLAKNGPWWDVALTSGYPAWCFTGDDAHNADGKYTGTRFLYVDSERTDRASVIQALKAGHFLCASRKDEGADQVVFPTAFTASAGTLSVMLSAPAAKLRWVGAGGRVLREEHDVAESSSSMGTEPYQRLEIETTGQDVYFNPIRRCATPGAPGR